MGITLESCGLVKVNSLTENISAGFKKPVYYNSH